MQTTTDKYTCEACGEKYGRDCQDPVTVNGWYGNEHATWINSGLWRVMIDKVRCPKCKHIQKPGDSH